jgi:conjugal transfer pilus assembly protein TraD
VSRAITDSLPKIRLKTVMRTQASSTQSDNPLLFSGNAGERLIEEEGDLLPPAPLGHLPNLEYIGRLAGGRTIKGRLPILVEPDAVGRERSHRQGQDQAAPRLGR